MENAFRAGLVAASLLVASCGAEGSTSGGTASEVESDGDAAAAETPIVDEGPRLTGPQRNAVRSARSYLQMTGFSRAGLIEQLSSDYGDGYDVADATIAVDSLTDVDWNENAARSARSYLQMTGFSCRGLIEQLSSDYGDRYTPDQAAYGAAAAGAC